MIFVWFYLNERSWLEKPIVSTYLNSPTVLRRENDKIELAKLLLLSFVCSMIELYCNKLYKCQEQWHLWNKCQLLKVILTQGTKLSGWAPLLPVSYLSLSLGLINVITVSCLVFILYNSIPIGVFCTDFIHFLMKFCIDILIYWIISTILWKKITQIVTLESYWAILTRTQTRI